MQYDGRRLGQEGARISAMYMDACVSALMCLGMYMQGQPPNQKSTQGNCPLASTYQHEALVRQVHVHELWALLYIAQHAHEVRLTQEGLRPAGGKQIVHTSPRVCKGGMLKV